MSAEEIQAFLRSGAGIFKSAAKHSHEVEGKVAEASASVSTVSNKLKTLADEHKALKAEAERIEKESKELDDKNKVDYIVNFIDILLISSSK